MAEFLLKQVLSDSIDLDLVINWLKTPDVNDEFSCTRGEFISYVLNYIHEESSRAQNAHEANAKKSHTPKSIRKLEVAKPKRRSALFTPVKCVQTLDSSTDCVLFQDEPQKHHSTPPQNWRNRTFSLQDFISPARSKNFQKSTPECDAKKSRRINPTSVQRERNFRCANSFDFKQTEPGVNANRLEFTERTPVKVSSSRLDVTEKVTLESAQNKEKMEKLCRIFAFFVKENMVLNITSELYLVLSLLLLPTCNANSLFATIHDAFYFGVQFLENCFETLGILDKTTLRLLVESNRLADSAIGFRIRELSEQTADLTSNKELAAGGSLNVCFVSETDSREHFPSDASFHAFRKQRDLFYEILSNWKTNHLNETWNFHFSLATKIRNLLNLFEDVSNHQHLSRLIQKQLLVSCANIETSEDQKKDSSEILQRLPSLNSLKLDKLRSRLTARENESGLNSQPTFAGVQEFYKNFIEVASVSSYNFLIHFKNALINEILTLNDSDAEQVKTNFETLLTSLQLLAKFVALIECLPFRSHSTVTAEELIVRKWHKPSMDFDRLYEEALRNQTMDLFVPWLCYYLALLDAGSLRLQCYGELLKNLFLLYRNLNDSESQNALLVKLHLGWLFEQENFPSEQYFLVLDAKSTIGDVKFGKFIEKYFLYKCCPYLKEFRKLLQSQTSNFCVSVKHITPVTAIETGKMQTKLKVQLQEAFLNSKSTSLRKTLEFISERVSSMIIKEISLKIIPETKLKQSEVLRATLISSNSDCSVEFIEKFAEKSAEALKKICGSFSKETADRKCEESLRCLLWEDEISETVAICKEIASTSCANKVGQWIQTHINAALFRKEFENVVSEYNGSPKGQKTDFVLVANPDEGPTLSPSALITEIQKLCVQVFEGIPCTERNLLLVLDNCKLCKNRRDDLKSNSWTTMNKLLFHLLFLYVVHTKDARNLRAVIAKFTAFWTDTLENPTNDLCILTGANLLLVNRSNQSWKNFQVLLEVFLEDNLMENFEEQLIALYRCDYQQSILSNLSDCLTSLSCKYPAKTSFLISFIADYCCNLNY